MPAFLRLTPAAAPPETTRPAPEKLISGDPVHTTWNAEDRDGLYCGIWQSTPGKWRISYDEWEYCVRTAVYLYTDELVINLLHRSIGISHRDTPI